MSEKLNNVEQFARKMISPIVASVMLFQSITLEAHARVRWETDKGSGRYEMTHENEENGQQTHVRWKTYSEIANNPSKKKIENSFFERQRKLEIEMPQVNEAISDFGAWKEYVWREAETLGVSQAKKDDLKPKRAIDTAIAIIQKNMKPAYDLVPPEMRAYYNYPSNIKPYNPKKEEEINRTPIDRVLIERGEGVCTHYSVLLDKIYEVFSQDPKCPYLQNTITRRIPLYGGFNNKKSWGHALTAVFDLKEGARNNSFFEDIAFLDTTLSVPEVQFSSEWLDVETNLPFISPYHDYIAPAFSEKERIQSLEAGIEVRPDTAKGMARHIGLAFEYLGAIRELYKKGSAAQALALFEKFREFFRKHKDQYANDAASAEYDLLYSIFSNIYRIRADYESNKDIKTEVESENKTMMEESYKKRFEALANKGDFKRAVRAGEEYADLIGRSGDETQAEQLYHQLFAFCQKHAQAIGSYNSAMKVDEDGDKRIVSVKPFENEESLKKYIEYKKNSIWKEK